MPNKKLKKSVFLLVHRIKRKERKGKTVYEYKHTSKEFGRTAQRSKQNTFSLISLSKTMRKGKKKQKKNKNHTNYIN